MIGGLFLNSKSRTQYSAYNTSIALFSRAAAILMGYVVRVVFTHVLSENYVGINGLFTDILNVLSLSEMGIETAISFALYKPIADGNTEAQKSIMHLYQWFYRFVAVFVAAAGICVIPFMDILIKNKPDIPHLTYIYILYLFNTVLSYLFVYKRTLLDAHQLMYIGTLSKTVSWVLQDIVQIAVLLLTKNFILYLYVYILTTLFSNIYISKKAERIFPFLRDKNIAPVEKQDFKLCRHCQCRLLFQLLSADWLCPAGLKRNLSGNYRQCRQPRRNSFQRTGADDFFFRLFTQPLDVFFCRNLPV